MCKSFLMQPCQQALSANLIKTVPFHVSIILMDNAITNSLILLVGTSGYTFRNVSVGKHRIQVIGRPHINPLTKKVLKLQSFTIKPPKTTIPPSPPPHVTATAQVFNNCSARLMFSADVTATFRCRVNKGPWKPCKYQIWM